MTTTNPPAGRVQRMIGEFRQGMEAEEAVQMADMARTWLEIERRLQAQMELLAREAADLRAASQPVTRAQLYRMKRYRDLLGQAQAETLKYQKWAAAEIAARQAEMAKLGVVQSQALIRESYLEAGKVAARFNLLPVEAVEAMIGFAGNGTPLNDLLMADYPDTIERLTGTLIRATAQGINPRETARLMARDMSGNLQRALTISRTEQIRAYRTAATSQMKESGVVDGWIWRAALQDNTCLACLAMDGTEHELDEELDDHPNGRCFKQPRIKGLEPLAAQSGADWFAAQSEETQRGMMGDKRFEGWQQGQIEFSQLATVKHSDEWGSYVSVAPLEALIP
jgi:hypothetical protein